jgi:hypothetical protein
MMPHELVEFLESAFIEEKIDSFARAELAFLVLALATLGSSAFFRFCVALPQFFKAAGMFAVSTH